MFIPPDLASELCVSGLGERTVRVVLRKGKKRQKRLEGPEILALKSASSDWSWRKTLKPRQRSRLASPQ